MQLQHTGGWGGGALYIVVFIMFSTLAVMLSTFGNVEFKPHIFLLHSILLNLLFFVTGYVSE